MLHFNSAVFTGNMFLDFLRGFVRDRLVYFNVQKLLIVNVTLQDSSFLLHFITVTSK